MNLFYYLLEANAYLFGFYVFYRIVLRNETFYTLNRFYLLAASLISFILPAIKLSGLQKDKLQYMVYTSVETVQDDTFWTAFHISLVVYLLVAGFLLVRLGIRLYRIFSLIRQGTTKIQSKFRMVEIKEDDFSFSFMNYLFVNPDLPKIDTIIRHEQVHILQKHSLDILFFEVLQIVNWFNPLISNIQDEAKAVHEFIADEETAVSESSSADYALFLIQNSYGSVRHSLSSQMFSKTLLKKRIVMLNQERSKAKARIKYAFALLLLPAMICTSAMAFTKTYGLVDLMPQEVSIITLAPSVEARQDTSKRLPPPPPQPPKPKVDQVKFPPPVVVPSSKSGNIVASPKPKVDQVKFPPPVVVPSSKSGNRLPPPPPQPPKPKVDQVKFPPPVVVPASKSGNRLPPPPPQPPKPKVDQVKFPPPVVVPASKSGNRLPPPPPQPPRPKVDQVKFPPPVVVPASKSGNRLPPPPPQPPRPKVDQVKFPPPVVVPSSKSGNRVPPPPPQPPRPKVDQVKFPPPVVVPASKSKDILPPPPPEPPKPKEF